MQALNQNQRLANWSKQVEACRNSGLTVAQWCRENNVAIPTYYARQRKVFQSLNAAAEVCFAEVPAAESEQTSSVKIHCHDFTIEVDGNTHPSVMRTIIETLKSC